MMYKIVNDNHETIDNFDCLSLYDAEKQLNTCVNNGQNAFIANSECVLGMHYIEGVKQGFEAYDTMQKWNGAKVLLFTKKQAIQMLKIIEFDYYFEGIGDIELIVISDDQDWTIKKGNNNMYSFDGWLFT